MNEVATRDVPRDDDSLTVCAISVLAAMVASVLHEGVGHAAIALMTGAQSGLLTAVAWSSEHDSRLVAAGGTLVNLAAGAIFWVCLRYLTKASVRVRYFLYLCAVFNLFDGTGYFFFSGVTNFGDWASVVEGLHPHWLLRLLLIVVGAVSYFGAVRLAGVGLIHDVGVSPKDSARLSKLTLTPYVSAIVIIGLAGLLNPIGVRLVWQSALPATAGAYSGLIWFRHYLPKGLMPAQVGDIILRSYTWIVVAGMLSLIFIVVLGHGITLSP